MNYNSKINLLKNWCIDKSHYYQEKYLETKDNTYIRYLTTNEIAFKLLMLIDKDFESDIDFCNQIKENLNIHFDHILNNPPNNTSTYMIEKINKEFLDYVQEVMSLETCESDFTLPYKRVIIGEEADKIIAGFKNRWNYENTSYWFPLMGDYPTNVADKFFIMSKYLTPYWEIINDKISLHNDRIYSYGESFYNIKFCMETSDVDEYCGDEWAYTDKDYTWMIYFSHEETVSFAGTIVPIVKDILIDEKDKWDTYEFL